MTPQVRERPKDSRAVGTPEIFTYRDWDEVKGVNITLGRRPQEPAAEPEGLGNVGHGYWDEVHVGAQFQEWTASPCGGCGKKMALTLTGSEKGGVGGGTLNFLAWRFRARWVCTRPALWLLRSRPAQIPATRGTI